ncbi:MAG: hypothetical protein HC879_03050 [Leptolyngbyaceae cyanobacterium SL_5_9]|nr:hypothetical protein [Leptolyngbyaceae cyanobacterium SL_5_9]
MDITQYPKGLSGKVVKAALPLKLSVQRSHYYISQLQVEGLQRNFASRKRMEKCQRLTESPP